MDSCIITKKDEAYKRFTSNAEGINLAIKREKDRINKNQVVIDKFRHLQALEDKNIQEVIDEYNKLFNLSSDNNGLSIDTESSTQTAASPRSS